MKLSRHRRPAALQYKRTVSGGAGLWNPSTYLSFQQQRDRPARDLLDRIAVPAPNHVVDLGCGAGNVTAEIAQRWPNASVEAIDSSPEMVRATRERGFDARIGDVRDWRPAPETDMVFCNAVLQWVPEHLDLLRGWVPELANGARFAFQVPGNFDAASHVLVRELAAEPHWRDRLGGALLGNDVVLSAVDYADALAGPDVGVDTWETTYVHALEGADPVLEWVSGTTLRPIRAALSESAWEEFRAELAPRLRKAYPPRSDGVTWFPFRRVFVLLHRR